MHSPLALECGKMLLRNRAKVMTHPPKLSTASTFTPAIRLLVSRVRKILASNLT